MSDDPDDFDVALDAWMAGDRRALRAFNVTHAGDLIRLATHAHGRGRLAEAKQMYEEARRASPRVCLRGDARVLAERTRKQLRDEVADLMQWQPRWIRIGFSTSPSINIVKIDSSYDNHWRAWWTEEDATEAAYREAWRRTMEDAIEEARWMSSRVARKSVDAMAYDFVDRLRRDRGIGELLGTPGPLLTTISGFVLVQNF